MLCLELDMCHSIRKEVLTDVDTRVKKPLSRAISFNLFAFVRRFRECWHVFRSILFIIQCHISMRLWNADGITSLKLPNYLGFFSCIALPRKIVDIIRAFIYSSPLSRNLICLSALWMFMNTTIALKNFNRKELCARVQDGNKKIPSNSSYYFYWSL